MPRKKIHKNTPLALYTVKNYPLFSSTVVALILAILFMVIGMTYVSYILIGSSVLVVLTVLIKSIVTDVKSGLFGVDVLAVLALITSMLMAEYWTGMIIVLMLTGGQALEDFAHNRAKSELDALLKRAPKKARLIHNGKETIVTAASLQVNDVIIVKPGELIAADAVILEGSASIDESSLTGESLPIIKQEDDELLSGTINTDGMLTARVIRPAKDSQYQQIVELVKNASAQKSPFVRLADRYALPFTIVALSIAFGAWWLSGDSLRFLQVLVVATPCPLILAAPIAIVSGMSRSAKHGIIIKNGGALEGLAEVKTIAFDKTGTLTHGNLTVDSIVALGKWSKQDVILYAASAEKSSNHIVGQALARQAAYAKIKLYDAKNSAEQAGLGLSATVNNKPILIGRLQYISNNNVAVPSAIINKEANQTTVYLSIDGELAGFITFKDEIRDESKQTINRLQNLGIRHFLMVTGDAKKTAEHIGGLLGIDRIIAKALPADKLYAIKNIPADQRPVAFVGDGINDAPVLASADVGIALGAKGAAVASESADIVIMQDSLSQVATAIATAKRTFYIAKQSIFAGIGLSIALMLVFATGKFSPLVGAFAQEVVDVVVILNALRAHRD